MVGSGLQLGIPGQRGGSGVREVIGDALVGKGGLDSARGGPGSLILLARSAYMSRNSGGMSLESRH